MQNIAIIGREKHLAYAEAESVFGVFDKLGDDAILFTSTVAPKIDSLGSIIKTGLVLTRVSKSSDLADSITEQIIQHHKNTTVNSVDFGISVYASSVNEKIYKHILISIKKNLKSNNVKCRFVLPKQMQLNTAQVKHNNLLKNGIEILVVENKDEFIVAKTTQLQDIDSYSLRDFGRPSRDMQVGMFPPKLAQIMLNLANIEPGVVVYDPFCGSGVVLQEALLRGNTSWGSDLSDTMVKASTDNLSWLVQKYNIEASYKLFKADAVSITDLPPGKFCIITEGYLGKMLSTEPTEDVLSTLQQELSELFIDFFKNLASLAQKPLNIVITLPCWQTTSGLKMLNIVDQIINLGYTIKQFDSVRNEDLIYKRPNQIVGRQILVLNLSKRN